MRLLFCCDLYHPSVGGVQEVVRQIAERMVQAGHDVTVATRRLPDRNSLVHNGVRIAEFDVSGDRTTGLAGEVERYREFLTTFPADAIMIKAAHQWSFDACWDVLDRIQARKVFIPCGFSQFYNPAYRAYFDALPGVLRKFDHLIFYAEHYRDIDFARRHAITNLTIVPNGASDVEFAAAKDPQFRGSLGIPADDFVILSLGIPPIAKGFRAVAAAFANLDTKGRSISLVLNSDWNEVSLPAASVTSETPDTAGTSYIGRAVAVLREGGPLGVLKRALLSLWYRSRTAWLSVFSISIDYWIDKATADPLKKVFKTSLTRDKAVQAFLSADLFVFASTIEYSPLVLFEAAAAGLPFVSVPVGNAEEIARWTGSGVICPAARDRRGLTRVDPRVLAQTMAHVIADAPLRERLRAAGRNAWLTTFNWRSIARRYEAILAGLPVEVAEQGADAGVSARVGVG
jgi:glycosyltransferase involved in cell wall biosynthesis